MKGFRCRAPCVTPHDARGHWSIDKSRCHSVEAQLLRRIGRSRGSNKSLNAALGGSNGLMGLKTKADCCSREENHGPTLGHIPSRRAHQGEGRKEVLPEGVFQLSRSGEMGGAKENRARTVYGSLKPTRLCHLRLYKSIDRVKIGRICQMLPLDTGQIREPAVEPALIPASGHDMCTAGA